MEQRPVNPWTWQDNFGFSQAIEFSGHSRVLVCAGQTSVDENGAPQHTGDMAAQVDQAMTNLEAVLAKAGMDLSNIVRMNLYTTDVDKFMQGFAPIMQHMKGHRPASTLLGVARLAFPELMVEIEATAVA
ncbi:MAG TPA: RidA family protein [Dehalococcoidia bacterium]|nr:RidA family protein [Dehalococcoidia bacterium]